MKSYIEFKELEEALKIVKKNFNFKLDGWEVEINDGIDHTMVSRIQDRTDVKLNKIQEVIQKGLNYIIKKYNNNFFELPKNLVSIHFKKSKFICIYLVKPENKYIRISTVLAEDMETKSLSIKWTLNEFVDSINYSDVDSISELYNKGIYSPIHLNESDKDCTFIIEKNTREEINSTKEVSSIHLVLGDTINLELNI